MTCTERFKKIGSLVCFLFPFFVFPQTNASVDEPLPIKLEKLELIFQNRELLDVPITLFNKTSSKVLIGNYGEAKIKKNSPSQSTTKILGITYGETNYKFFIDFTNSSKQTAQLTGTKKFNDVLEGIKATITTSQENSSPWELILQMDKVDLINIDQGKLTQGQRTIEIIRRNFRPIEDSKDVMPGARFYEFLENGISLGVVAIADVNTIWLSPDLDPTTKLVLCTAMLSIAH